MKSNTRLSKWDNVQMSDIKARKIEIIGQNFNG